MSPQGEALFALSKFASPDQAVLKFQPDDITPNHTTELGIGVFYFPSTALTKDEQIAAIDKTYERLQVLVDSINQNEFIGRDCFRVSDLLAWLGRFQALLSKEATQLRLTPDNSNSTDAPSTTLNGHKENHE